MSRASVLARAQAAAEAGMVDACQIRRAAGESTDDASGVVTPTYATVYTGVCRVQQHQAQAQQQDAGQAYLLMLKLELQLPLSAVGLRVGDQATITASRDPDLVGRVFLLHDLAHKTDASCRRVQCVERTS